MQEEVKEFWELVQRDDAMLFVDNDSCFIQYGKLDEYGEPEGSRGFDFQPSVLVEIFAEKLGIKCSGV